MSYIISTTTADELQCICRYHTRRENCGAECPLKCICGELVRDWPVRGTTNEIMEDQ